VSRPSGLVSPPGRHEVVPEASWVEPELLIRNPFREFSVRQLRDITDNGSKTTSRAVALLQQLALVRVDESGRSKRVRINRERVSIPDEPLFRLPQDEFREPVRAFAERVRTEVPSFSALLVFGSVARGEADRRSDIDVWMRWTATTISSRRDAGPPTSPPILVSSDSATKAIGTSSRCWSSPWNRQ